MQSLWASFYPLCPGNLESISIPFDDGLAGPVLIIKKLNLYNLLTIWVIFLKEFVIFYKVILAET